MTRRDGANGSKRPTLGNAHASGKESGEMSHHVVYAVDEDYWMPLYVSIHSLLSNNRDLTFDIHVFYDERDETFFERVEALDRVHRNFSIEGVQMDEPFEDGPTPHWFTEAVFYRFQIGTTLESTAENVLYLDCDTIVDGSLTELFAMDLHGRVVAATPEYKLRSFELGLPLDALFYNAGVMYINVDQWQQYGVMRKMRERLEADGDVDFPVQEHLNPILHADDMWEPLHPKYNAMTNWASILQNEKDEQPIIIHYTGRSKPWQYTTERPYGDRWWEYLAETPYRNYECPDKTVVTRFAMASNRLGSRAKRTIARMLNPFPRLKRSVANVAKLLFQ